ncbi:MAG: hypothetical protein OEZ54_08505 [Gemmatimonadota bacterium]|nr:hypothetical protein [Gemmatimonadota bacterium]
MSNQPEHMDALGQLCQDGLNLSQYLCQVPDDEAERQKLRGILEKISQDPGLRGRKEFPAVVKEMQDVLARDPSPMDGDELQSGFDRMVKLWQAARSGLHGPIG